MLEGALSGRQIYGHYRSACFGFKRKNPSLRGRATELNCSTKHHCARTSWSLLPCSPVLVSTAIIGRGCQVSDEYLEKLLLIKFSFLETFYYKRTDDYKKILHRKQIGCFQVPMIHTAVLINMRMTESDILTYLPDNVDNYPGPQDDIIVFALSATLQSLSLHICNDNYYGVVSLPLEDGQTLGIKIDYIELKLSLCLKLCSIL